MSLVKQNVRTINELLKLVKISEENVKKMSTTEIVKILEKLSDAYHIKGTPLVQDSVYDYIRDYLEEVDPENPFLSKVGAPVTGSKEEVELPFEMGSLQKFKPDDGRLAKWLLKYPGPYYLSDKLDGASAQLWKNHSGKLYFYSRGDGTNGTDISHLIPMLFDTEVLDNIPVGTSIRGELIISIKNFAKVSSYMKNARNAVAGLVNSKTVDPKVAGITNFVTYAVLSPRYTQDKQYKLLKSWGLQVVNHKKVTNLTDDNLTKDLTLRKKNALYEMDGLVCVDDSVLYEHKGGYPDHMFAFKMITEDQMSQVTVTKITWKISKYGYLKPTINIKPVNLKGVTVKKATAHNAKFIVDNKIGQGSVLKVIRSGDVIPYIMEVLSPSTSGEGDLPDVECEWNATGVDLIVKKLEGSSKKVVTVKLLHGFFSGIGVKQFGEERIAKFVSAGYDTVAKILTADKDDLAELEGIGHTIVQTIYDEIDKAFDEMSLVTFMSASHKFGRGLAEKKLQKILDVYPDILKQKWNETEMIEKIQQVEGFSEKLATLFTTNLKSFKVFYNEISKIKDISKFNKIEKKVVKTGLKFSGMSFVFTGKRDKELEQYIKDNGGIIEDTFKKTCSYLIHDDNADTSHSKFEKAEKANVKIISNSAFKLKYNI
jgi:NAD-dependent DNA ligase